MYPHERALVKRYKDRPFTLLGVNSDSDLGQLKLVCKKQGIRWPNFHDKTTSGPIAKAWNVSGWPTVYLIDHKGVIRYKDVRGKQLDRAVEKLMAEAEARSETKKTTDK